VDFPPQIRPDGEAKARKIPPCNLANPSSAVGIVQHPPYPNIAALAVWPEDFHHCIYSMILSSASAPRNLLRKHFGYGRSHLRYPRPGPDYQRIFQSTEPLRLGIESAFGVDDRIHINRLSVALKKSFNSTLECDPIHWKRKSCERVLHLPYEKNARQIRWLLPSAQP